MLTILINLLIILVIIAVFYLILYLFSKYVSPIDGKVTGILIFIAFALLVIWLISGHTLLTWR